MLTFVVVWALKNAEKRGQQQLLVAPPNLNRPSASLRSARISLADLVT